jgi:hypothetical protein
LTHDIGELDTITTGESEDEDNSNYSEHAADIEASDAMEETLRTQMLESHAQGVPGTHIIFI